MDGMSLQDLIDDLSKRDPNAVARPGFCEARSYRGYYECLGFEPCDSATAGDMLRVASYAVGRTYSGYKGGEYTMGLWTPCYLAPYGCTGEPLTKLALRGMFAPDESGAPQ